MAKEKYFKQFRLSKEGHQDQVGWMLEKFATKGAFLKVKMSDGSWDDGWQVKSFGDERRTSEQITRIAYEYRKHRKETDQ